jgi:hypothetical protein
MQRIAKTLSFAFLLLALAAPGVLAEDEPRKANPSDPDIELEENTSVTTMKSEPAMTRISLSLLSSSFPQCQ